MDLFNLKSFVLFLSVFGCCAGQDLLEHGPVDATFGKSHTFTPALEAGESFLSLSWSFSSGDELIPIVTLVAPNVENIVEDYKGRVTVNMTNGILTLGPLKSTDSGDYAVTMISKKGVQQTGQTHLRVLEPVTDVVIKSSLAEAVELNSTVVLTCSAKGSFLKFSWINGTTPIVADAKKLTITTTGSTDAETSSTLTVKDVLRTDLVGPIYCSAANNLETQKSAPFNLSVSYGPDMIDLTVKPALPANMVLRMDSNLTLSCPTQSSPPATLAWYHNGVVLPKATAATLVLEMLKEAKSGNYSCMATNAKTLRSMSSKVIHFTVMQAVSGTTLTGPTATLLAGKQQTANLSCQATAGKPTARAWFKDGKPLSPGDRVTVSADKSMVSIKPVQKEDNGDYRCELTNAVNSDSATYKMVVNYGPEAATVTGVREVEINKVVKLTCAAMSMPPATYIWKFNGTKTDITTAEYPIEMTVYKNTGLYTCEAHNAITGLSSSAIHKLSVKEEGALDDDEGLSGGAIAGIVIAVLIVLAVAIYGVYYFTRPSTSHGPVRTEDS